MERYSTWRDPATGIAPFLSPVPSRQAGDGNIAALALLPVCWLIAAIRLLLIAIFLILKLVLIDVLLVFTPWPIVHDLSTHAINAAMCRSILAGCGFYWIQSEKPKSRVRTPVKLAPPQKERLVIANWSSPLDIIYLTFRYNCRYFLLPVLERKPDATKPGARTPVIGVVRLGFINALRRVGQPPLCGRDHSAFYPSLYDAIKGTKLTVAVFPEATTSNNRGLLRFSTIPLGGIRTLSPELRLVSLKYESPSALMSSVTAPIPSLLNPLGHFFRINATLPLPRALLVRTLSEAEGPSLVKSANSDAEFWQASATAMNSLGRWKSTALGGDDKFGFILYTRQKA